MKTYEITVLDERSNIIHQHFYEAYDQDEAYQNAMASRKHFRGSEWRVNEVENIVNYDGRTKGQKLYDKLWACMRKALADHDKYGCHCNEIAVHLGRSVESQQTYYNTLIDVWCDYFLND